MSFRSIVRDVRDGFGSLSRRSFEVRLPGHSRGKSHGSVHELHEQPLVIQNSRWAGLPPELLRDVIKRLEASEGTWPARKHVVACAAVCRSWREICKEIVKSPEFSGKITFPVSLKQVCVFWYLYRINSVLMAFFFLNFLITFFFLGNHWHILTSSVTAGASGRNHTVFYKEGQVEFNLPPFSLP